MKLYAQESSEGSTERNASHFVRRHYPHPPSFRPSESVDTEAKKVEISVKGESGLYLQEYTIEDDKVLKKLGDSVGYDIDFVKKDRKLDEILSISRPR